jgi:hypothetical protein
MSAVPRLARADDQLSAEKADYTLRIEEAACVVVNATARVAPVPGHTGDARNRPDGHAAAGVTLKADADPDAGGPDLG